MKQRLFISWSKEPSRTIALELRAYIPMILHNVDPWVSEVDIPKGGRWSPEIARMLDETDTGIIVVTASNKLEPWLYFEAGALSKSVADAKVHPLVVGMEKGELVGPLQQFQATSFIKADFLELLFGINKGLQNPETERAITERFDRVWDGLSAKVNAALAKANSEPVATPTTPVVSNFVVNDEQEKILKFLVEAGPGRGRQGMDASQIAPHVNMHQERVKLHLDALTKNEYIFVSLNMLYGARYSLADKGRQYALDKGWI